MNISTKQIIASIAIGIVIAITSSSLYMVNTGDYYRATFPFLDDIIRFTKEMPHSLPMKDDIGSIFSYGYKSSYNYLVYSYAMLIRTFTNNFNLFLYSFILKLIYIYILTILFSKINKINNTFLKFILFLTCLLPMISSSNLAFFGSFYQEQVLLIFMPILIISTFSNQKSSILLAFVSVLIISTSKSQFFYLPVLIAFYYLIFNRELLTLKISLMTLSFIIAITCIATTNSTVEYNKYHSEYFGVYEYEKINGIELPKWVDNDCVGIDSSGNRFDIEKGVTQTNIGENCFNKHTDASFKRSISEFIKHPSIIFMLPFDSGVKSQLTENYFHVYKEMDLIINNKGFYYNITLIKDLLFKESRFPVLLISLTLSLLFRKHWMSGLVFIASTIGCSQFYMAFFGEGYRDMSKHLFGMNFSFDVVLFTSIAYLLGRLYCRLIVEQNSSKKRVM
ncbi:hypothetical protein [Rahnella inusitata]|uniref:hypothetical protein n=1 Tax=Rahnella inusitata TaxID=58169 RepID=UPI0039BE2CCD